jgi:hypothetical protein
LEKVAVDTEGVRLILSGVDILDQTPVVDVKPYVPYCDSILDANGGFTADPPCLEVRVAPQAEEFCRRYQERTGIDLHQLMVEILCRDPRPASQKATPRSFGTLLYEVNIRWRAEGEMIVVEECRSLSPEKSDELLRGRRNS